MKIRKKGREESVLEKRNTALFTFVSVALIPILLTFMLGLNLGYGSHTNVQNLHKKVDVLHREIDSLNGVVRLSEEQMSDLHKTFMQADSIFEIYKEEDFATLETKLDAAKDELAINKWNHDREEVISNFNHEMNLLSSTYEYTSPDNHEHKAMFNLGKKWLVNNVISKDNELYAIKLYKKQGLGISVAQDIEEKIEALKQMNEKLNQEATKKDNEITNLNRDLQRSTREKQEMVDEMSGDTQTEKQKVMKLEKTLNEKEQLLQRVKNSIILQLDGIKEVLPNLQGQKFLKLKNNETEVEKFKKGLELKLNAIERSALEL